MLQGFVENAQEVAWYAVYCALLCVYAPVYVMASAVVCCNVVKLTLRKLMRLRATKAKLGIISRKSRVSDVVQVSTEEELDFQKNRSGAYVRRLTLWTPAEIANLAIGKQKIELISDEHLAYIILHTVFGHSVIWNEEREMFQLLLEGFEDLFLFEGFYWDARHVFVSADGKKLIISMDDKQEYSSDCSEEDRPDYELAKLHVQVCLTYFAPGLAHNHVHFVLPSAMCVLSKSLLDKKGTLYNLLAPHFRFTERINYQALRVGKATNNKRSMIDRCFFLWQPFPVTKEQFIEGVARKCKKHYHDNGASSPPARDASHDDDDVSSGWSSSDEPEERHRQRDHMLFPPAYVTDKNVRKVPYLSFLRRYYLVVRKFVKSVAPFIDKREWEELSTAVARHVPKFETVNMIDAISTFIHQVGVVHFCDHNSYVRYFAYAYGSMAIRHPFERYAVREHWDDTAALVGASVGDIQRDPAKWLIAQRDVMRTRCFLNIFVDYITNPSCDMRLVTTQYDFSDELPRQAALTFITGLRKLDGVLKDSAQLIDIPQLNGEKRATGRQLVPLDDIIRSVCY